MTTPKPYRSRSTVYAMGPLTRENGEEIARWCDGRWSRKNEKITFYSEGHHDTARLGDMIVIENGRCFTLYPALLEALYDPDDCEDDDDT